MLILEKREVNKVIKAINRIYINTLTPNFYFKNKYEKIVNLENCCAEI